MADGVPSTVAWRPGDRIWRQVASGPQAGSGEMEVDSADFLLIHPSIPVHRVVLSTFRVYALTLTNLLQKSPSPHIQGFVSMAF